MKIEPLKANDRFIRVLDYDQKISGLTGNIAQLIIKIDGLPEKEKIISTIDKWINYEPALKRILKRGFFKDYWSIYNKSFKPYIKWHKDTSLDEVLKIRSLNNFNSIYNCPLLILDIIENINESIILITWHHILADARGGELIFSRLRDPSYSKIENFYNQLSTNQDGSIIAILNDLKDFRNTILKRMTENKILSLINNNIKKRDLILSSKHIQINKELSIKVKSWAKQIDPIFGETSLLIAISLKEIQKFINDLNNGNFLVPIPINLRNPTSIQPILGNPVSFIFLSLEKSEVKYLSLLKLTKLISKKLINDVKNNAINITNSALKLGKLLPYQLYRYTLRSTMQGQLGSMFFANTGLSHISEIPGKATDFLGHKIIACFHRPMVSIPPGIGFFYSTYSQKLHISICWIEGVISKDTIQIISDNIINNLKKSIYE